MAAKKKEVTAPKFSKEQILKSSSYSERRDLLRAVLRENKEYSHGDVEKIIDEFMKGKVK